MTLVPLSHEVKAHGETLSALTLREPRGADLVAAGLPFSLREEPGRAITPVIDPRSCRDLIARLADVPPSTVDALSVADFMAAAAAVMGFFRAPTPAPSSKPSST